MSKEGTVISRIYVYILSISKIGFDAKSDLGDMPPGAKFLSYKN